MKPVRKNHVLLKVRSLMLAFQITQFLVRMARNIDLTDVQRDFEPGPIIDSDEPNQALKFEPMRRKLRVITK